MALLGTAWHLTKTESQARCVAHAPPLTTKGVSLLGTVDLTTDRLKARLFAIASFNTSFDT